MAGLSSLQWRVPEIGGWSVSVQLALVGGLPLQAADLSTVGSVLQPNPHISSPSFEAPQLSLKRSNWSHVESMYVQDLSEARGISECTAMRATNQSLTHEKEKTRAIPPPPSPISISTHAMHVKPHGIQIHGPSANPHKKQGI
jgi:hypothetical protein